MFWAASVRESARYVCQWCLIGRATLIRTLLVSLPVQLILAFVDLAFRSGKGVLSRVAAAHSLAGMVTIDLVSVIGIGILIEPQLLPLNVLGMGPAVLAVAFGWGVTA